MKKISVMLMGFFFICSFCLALPADISPKILREGNNPSPVSLKNAFERALSSHINLRLERSELERRRLHNYLAIGSFLPKARLVSAYTRNIPEIETSLVDMAAQSPLYRSVAKLLRGSGDNAGAEELDKKADLLLQRSNNKIVLNPKNVFDAKLTVEVPIFNGPDLARLLATRASFSLQEATVRNEEAKTLYTTAQAYYLAIYLKNVLMLQEQAQKSAHERYLKAQVEKKRGLLIERDFLHLHAAYVQKKADVKAANLDFRTAIAQLGLLIGISEEFFIEDPDEIMFEALKGDADSLVAQALQHRSDLKALESAKYIAENERLEHFLRFLPTFNLVGDAKYTSNDKSLVGKNFTYAISVNASLSLFDGGLSLFQLRESSLKRADIEIKRRMLRAEIDANIRGRLEKISSLTLNEQARKLKAEAYIQSELVAIARYKRGVIESVDLLDASDERLAADIAYKKAQSELNEEKLALIYESGLLSPQFVE